jgi:hypothetical protein
MVSWTGSHRMACKTSIKRIFKLCYSCFVVQLLLDNYNWLEHSTGIKLVIIRVTHEFEHKRTRDTSRSP